LWEWEDALMELQLPKYKKLGLTEIINWENNNQVYQKERIINWTKRDDLRHHALDALVVACTEQGFIQKINSLSAQTTREDMYKEITQTSNKYEEKQSLLIRYLISKKPFTTEEVKKKLSEIIISFKPGKKVATYSRRIVKKNGKKIIVQRNILTPRGPLSEESIYGKIKIIDKDKNIKYLFEHPDLIVNTNIKKLIYERLKQHNEDIKKALTSLKKDPIYLNPKKKIILEKAHCFKEEFVLKYPLLSIKTKDINDIINKKIQEKVKLRLEKYNNNEKEAFKEPLYYDEERKIPIRSVRLFTKISTAKPIRKDEHNNIIAYVKPGNNHHIAIYKDSDDNLIEHVCTFWHAVERKKYKLPVIIQDTKKVWDIILTNKNYYPQDFLEQLPANNLQLELSMQQNEMFILDLSTEKAYKYIDEKNYSELSKHIYRLQKISSKHYVFRSHLEATLDDSDNAKKLKKFHLISSIKALFYLNPIKIKVNILGYIHIPPFNK